MSDLPLTIAIPLPTPQPRRRGYQSTGRFGTIKKFRCSLDDEALIEKAAAALGINASEFMRSCAVHAAQKILEATNDT